MFGDKEPEFDVIGDTNFFKLLNRVTNTKAGWTKRIKALEIPGVGCIVHMITEHNTHTTSETSVFIPGVRIVDTGNNGGRRLVKVEDEQDVIDKVIVGDKSWEVVIENECAVIHRNCYLDTIIELNRIKNESDLLRWVISILHEKGMSAEIVCEFIKAVNKVKGFELPERF